MFKMQGGGCGYWGGGGEPEEAVVWVGERVEIDAADHVRGGVGVATVK